MQPEPDSILEQVPPGRRLQNYRAIITGGDSGIGRAIAIAFAREGADVAILYLEEEQDAEETLRLIEEHRGEHGGTGHKLKGDLRRESTCRSLVERAAKKLGSLDVLINNAAVQFPQQSIEDIDEAQLVNTFRTNIFAHFFMTKAALPYLRQSEHASIINSTSVTAYRGNPTLLDYSSTKGAIVSFTRSLALQLAKENIRVNAVAPGPVWTPLIPSSFPEEKVETFGGHVPLGRAGHPSELAYAYIYLASIESQYVTGQTIHVNGGEVVNG